MTRVNEYLNPPNIAASSGFFHSLGPFGKTPVLFLSYFRKTVVTMSCAGFDRLNDGLELNGNAGK